MRRSWPAFLLFTCTLAWWSLGSAMAAKIEQFTDKEGKLHITNVEPEDQSKPGTAAPAVPGAKPQQPPAAAQLPPQAEPQVEASPAESPSETPPEAPQAEAPAAPGEPPGEQPQTGGEQQGSWRGGTRLPGYLV